MYYSQKLEIINYIQFITLNIMYMFQRQGALCVQIAMIQVSSVN